MDFSQAFCEGKVDVVFSSLSQPSGQHRKMRACGGEFLDIPVDLIHKMLAAKIRLQSGLRRPFLHRIEGRQFEGR